MVKNLKLLRQNKGISQKALADIISVSQQSINKYENHNVEPDIDTLIRLANYFNTSVDYLVGNTDIDHKLESVTFHHLNIDEEKLIARYRSLKKEEQLSIEMIIDNYISK